MEVVMLSGDSEWKVRYGVAYDPASLEWFSYQRGK
jgi:hypothetical protein